jgi:hypothetical protein
MTYKTIGEILNPFFNSSDGYETLLQLESKEWEKVVSLGSRHLMLPSIYYNLHKKKLLNHLPDDLTSFLQEIAELNTERNRSIQQQVSQISRLFIQENIEFVFLKGTALLYSDVYDNLGERMIGDIDILIHHKHIDLAYDLLLKHGYDLLEDTPGHAYLNPKHKPRLVHNDDRYIGAVEIHNRLFDNYYFLELSPASILKQKTKSKGIWVPKLEHLLLHTILNWQINDRGMFKQSFHFRTGYDCSVLLKRDSSLLTSKNLHSKVFTRFFSLYSVVYPHNETKHLESHQLRKSFFKIRLTTPFVQVLWKKTIRIVLFTQFLFGRMRYFLMHKKYRQAILASRSRQISKFKKIASK